DTGGGSLRATLGVRETGVDVPVGQDGGTTGPIEWIGASSVTNGVPQGDTVLTAQPGVWQTVTFLPRPGPLLPGNVLPYTGGDGALSAANNRGVLEHLAFSVVDTPGPFTIYLDKIDQPCTPSPDFDGDGDVDMEDFAHLQRCLKGPNILQDDPACENADLDGQG